MVLDHSNLVVVTQKPETMAISKFKATCLAALERVRRTKEPLVVTKRGVPIAKVVPIEPPPPKKSGYGAMAGTIEFLGDIVGPVVAPEEWDALR